MPGEPEGESQLQPKPPAPTNTPPEVRGILPHEPNPTEPKLPPPIVIADAERVGITRENTPGNFGSGHNT